MPNLAFHLEVLKQTTQRLSTNNKPQGKILAKHKKYAALGALGPDLLRYLPVSKALADSLANLAAQPIGQGLLSSLPPAEAIDLFRNPEGGAHSVLFRHLVVPVWPVLNNIKAFLDQMDQIAQTQNLLALPSKIGQLNNIQSQLTSLKGQLSPGLIAVIGQIIAIPPLRQIQVDFAMGNRLFEFIRWHRSGKFARQLFLKANTPEHSAYAYGFMSHVAASVTAEPFVNNITGGPYRSHWFRENHLVRNFVDSWTYGFYNSNASMLGDEPNPPYAAWKSLCSANIQEEFNVAGIAPAKGIDVSDAVKAMATGSLGSLPNQFPDDLDKFLRSAAGQTWDFLTPQPLDLKKKFKEGFVGAYAVYWFLTSGSGPMCNNPLGSPPPGCSTVPSWVTSPPNSVSSMLQQAGINVGAATCAVLLAISSVLLILTGNITLGVIALILALNQPIVDWNQIRCNLYWLRKLLVDAGNLIRNALMLAGFAYPPPQKLGTIDVNGKTQPANDFPFGPGVPLCRSNGILLPTEYPKRMDETFGVADLHFSSYPPQWVKLEEPSTLNLIPADQYPDYVVSASGSQNGGILADSTTSFPSSKNFFGDAVSNANDVIAQDGNGLQNYNLDADRGYGWKTWNPKIGTIPATPPVSEVPD